MENTSRGDRSRKNKVLKSQNSGAPASRTWVCVFVPVDDLVLINTPQTCHKVTRQAQSFNVLDYEWIVMCLNLSVWTIKRVHTYFCTYGTIPNPSKRHGCKLGAGGRHLQDVDVEVCEYNHITQLGNRMGIPPGI